MVPGWRGSTLCSRCDEMSFMVPSGKPLCVNLGTECKVDGAHGPQVDSKWPTAAGAALNGAVPGGGVLVL